MAITLYGYHDHPAAFAVTKIDAQIDDCEFILDFSRPLERVKRLWITVGFLVPIVHKSEHSASGFVVAVTRSDPHFNNIEKLWKEHKNTKRTLFVSSIGELEVVADFAKHFPEDVNFK